MKKARDGIFICLFSLLASSSAIDAQIAVGPLAGDYLSEAIAEGRVGKAIIKLEADASEAEKAGRWDQSAIFYAEASHAARLSGQLQRALSLANKGLELAEKARDTYGQTYAIYRLSQVFTSLGQYEKSREWIQKGIERAKLIRAGAFREAAESNMYAQLGQTLLRSGEIKEAIDSLVFSIQRRDSLISYSQRTGSKSLAAHQRGLVYTMETLGRAYQTADMVEEALQTYQKGLKIIEQAGLKTSVEANLNTRLGSIYLGQKNYEMAEKSLRHALETGETLQLSHIINLAGRLLGNVLQQTGRPAEAIPFYRKAVVSIESVRSLLEFEQNRSSFFADNGQSYVGIIRAHLQTENFEEAFNYNERARSRAFLDILGNKVQLAKAGSLFDQERELQERIAALQAKSAQDGAEEEISRQNRRELEQARKAYEEFLAKVRKESKEQASLMNVEPLTLKQVQDLLDPGMTLLEYFVANSNIWLWVVEKDRVQFIRSSIERRDLVSKVTLLRDSIYQLGEKEKFNALSQELYRLLIQPALPHIRAKDLLIIPHDVLHYLPFQALLSPQGRYLIEDYPINYLSSASLLQFTQEKRRAMGERVLAFGNPDLGDPEKNLEYAELEAQEIKNVYPQSAVYLKREASEEKAKALSPQNGILHFATHAELKEDDPLSSAILLTKDGKEDGRLEAREIFGMNLKASLVVLSGCDTGLGKLSTGDELVGLTRAFIYAGTPSVVASLWKVDDSSTAQLMSSFYRNLKTMTKVEALRQAQLELIRGTVRSDLLAKRGVGGVGKLGESPASLPQSRESVSISTSHPYFWAPFVLVGDGK